MPDRVAPKEHATSAFDEHRSCAWQKLRARRTLLPDFVKKVVYQNSRKIFYLYLVNLCIDISEVTLNH